MATKTNPLLTWLVSEDDNCPDFVLRAAWRTAVRSKDNDRMVEIAGHPAVSLYLDTLIGQVSSIEVRLAHLCRPGLPAQRRCELLVGEQRASVLGPLFRRSPSDALGDQILEVFSNQPSVILALALLDVAVLPAEVVVAMGWALIPRIETFSAGQDLRFTELMRTLAADQTELRVAVTTSLLEQPCVLEDHVRTMTTLLEAPLSAVALEQVGAAVFDRLLRRGHNVQWPEDWTALGQAVLNQPNVPASVLTLARTAIAQAGGQRGPRHLLELPAAALGPCSFGGLSVEDLRVTTDVRAFQVAATSDHPGVLAALLHNPALPDPQLMRVARTITLTRGALSAICDVPDPARRALMQVQPLAILRAFGWQWQPDPLAAQARMFDVARERAASQIRNFTNDLRLASETFRELLAVHAASPFDPQMWLQLPAPLLAGMLAMPGRTWLQVKDGPPIAEVIAESLSSRLGDADLAWETLLGMLESFTGSIGELIEVAVLLTVVPGSEVGLGTQSVHEGGSAALR